MANLYEKKRNLQITPEPPFKVKSKKRGVPIFVVQKHAARRLHYDLRLELDGVLKSWAVPAGPSLNPAVKRLAVMVEDHPMDYASFEGVIPQGQYGAGRVIVWDNGDYSPDEGQLHFDDREQAQEIMRKGLEKGKLSFTLRGEKLKGSWTLVKMKNGENNWLFFKHQDRFADLKRQILDEGKSVITGREVDEVTDEPAIIVPPQISEIAEAPKSLFPGAISPMLARAADQPFSSPDWYFEPKLDGYRIIAELNKGEVRLLSRNGHDVSSNYSTVAEGVKSLPASQLILDGEIIAVDEKGKSCFQCLQGFLEKRGTIDSRFKAAALIYYVFDILYADGRNLMEVPLDRRKEILDRVIVPSKTIRVLDRFEGDGKAIFKGAVEAGLEGVVAKRKNSLYRPGERTDDWVKVKAFHTDEFIIGGFTQGEGNRAGTFGSLILGYYDEQGRLLSSGQVGTGFDELMLDTMKKKLDAIKTKQSPFYDQPEVTSPPTWVKPEIVAEIKFSERTRDGKLRAPVFLRIRDDKPARQVNAADSSRVQIPAKPPDETALETDPDDDITGILKQLENPRDEFSLELDKDRLDLTNMSKLLWPDVTKRELLVYLTRVSKAFLKHLKDRPLSLNRFPDGYNGEHFFQKHWEHQIPKFVVTVPLSEESKKHRDYLTCNNLPTLLWLGQIADLELHTWFSRINSEPDLKIPQKFKTDIDRIDYLSRHPDFIIFDMDPYVYSGKEAHGDEPELSRKGFSQTCEIALRLKEILDGLKLSSFLKTSGRTGLHVYVPIVREFDFKEVHSAAKTVCTYLERKFPDLVSTEWAVEKRTGKIFLDYNQNVRGKTLASVYSPRPSKEATVSTPLTWDEVDKIYPTDFTIKTVPVRLGKMGDLWESILESKHDLRDILKLN